MPYEPGPYSKELEREHAAGQHDSYRDDNCTPCREADDEKYARSIGYPSYAALHEAVRTPEGSRRVERSLDLLMDHHHGEHREIPDPNCTHRECTERK